MPADHQRNAGGAVNGGGHVRHSATTAPTSPNRARFAIRLSKTGSGMIRGMSTDGPFGIYIHVPFCATRCGYCDFNTYTPSELGGANPDGWLAAVRVELELAAQQVGPRAVDTVFVGGGTPTMLGGPGLAAVLAAVQEHFPLAPGAEITTEANPESSSPELFATLRAAGYTRISLGMQSAAPHVLKVLDRVHSAGRAPAAALEARAEGFEHVNLDLIYGTPGETDDDLVRSIETALGADVDHVSAYALIVEDGTALARRVRRGELPAPDNDVLADRYELLDAHLSAAGLQWYEVSNWSRPGGECRHNLGYWDGGHWWGAGPGAHSFLGARRWWNIKHPNAYAQALAERRLPVADSEDLDDSARHIEDVMLRMRLRSGLPRGVLTGPEQRRADVALLDGLVVTDADRLVLTDRGRLLADAVVRDLLED